jgi:hypothetical protein
MAETENQETKEIELICYAEKCENNQNQKCGAVEGYPMDGDNVVSLDDTGRCESYIE